LTTTNVVKNFYYIAPNLLTASVVTLLLQML